MRRVISMKGGVGALRGKDIGCSRLRMRVWEEECSHKLSFIVHNMCGYCLSLEFVVISKREDR